MDPNRTLLLGLWNFKRVSETLPWTYHFTDLDGVLAFVGPLKPTKFENIAHSDLKWTFRVLVEQQVVSHNEVEETP